MSKSYIVKIYRLFITNNYDYYSFQKIQGKHAKSNFRQFMKIKFLVALICLIFAQDIFAKNKNKMEKFMDKKILIVYYSRTGNTKGIAEIIKTKIGGDLFEVDTVEKYPDNYHEATEVADKQIKAGIKPAIKANVDVSNYDIIFIGTPAWWGKMAPALNTFIDRNNFEGKKIVPFVTHGGGGIYAIDKDMANLTKAETLKPFSIYGLCEEWVTGPKKCEYPDNVKKDIENWLSKLEL